MVTGLIDSNPITNHKLEIFDLMGRPIEAEWSELGPGLYIVKFETKTIKILKQQ